MIKAKRPLAKLPSHFATLFVVALCLSISLLISQPAFAGSGQTNNNTAAHGKNGQPAGMDPLAGLTTAEKQKLTQKQVDRTRFKRTHSIGNVTSPNDVPYMNVVLNVPFYTQSTEYYCGPASVAMVLGYNGLYPTQQSLANDMGTNSTDGTYVYRVRDELNTYFNNYNIHPTSSWVWQYDYLDMNSFQTYINNTTYDLNVGQPLILNVQTDPPDGTQYQLPYYGTNYYHYIVFHGRTGQYDWYTDPFHDPTGTGPTEGRHNTDIYNLFYVTQFQHYMID